ncbi:MAG: hypothetical protein QOG89_3793 [Thermomicrobiales bacterium]|nr:hypothetical protein [Thermomicrobiales bacterium]
MRLIMVLLAGLLTPAVTAQSASPPTQPRMATKTQIAEAYGDLPLSFEVNQGQSDASVRFLARGSGYALFLTPSEAVLALHRPHPPAAGGDEAAPAPSVLRMTLLSANPIPRVVGLDQQPGRVNYLHGNRRERWGVDVPTYARVHYREVYTGVDLVYYGNHRQLEFDFVVAPGANPDLIRLGFVGSRGIVVDAGGDLVMGTDGEQLRLPKPLIYQQVGDARYAIDGGYTLDNEGRVGFWVDRYDPIRPLVIDPVLVYSTFLGGDGLDEGRDITVDATGHAYVAGVSTSSDFPTVTPSLAPRTASNDAFVTKLSVDGGGLVFSTYLGGGDNDEANGIAVDAEGNVYLGGVASSSDFPTMNPVSEVLSGTADAFVAKLSASGDALLYSTYLGGSVGFVNGADTVIDLALDVANAVYITGITTSDDFPASSGAAQASHGGSEDAYVAKFDPSATGTASLVYATYLGGSALERGVSIAVDKDGNAYVAGRTDSTDFPTTASAFQPGPQGGPPDSPTLDAFVTKLSPDGAALLYSTYLGGSGADLGYGIAVDASGIGLAYVTGHTYSTNFPVSAAARDGTLDGQTDAFVALLHTALTGDASRLSATYLGGTGDDVGFGIAVRPGSDVVVTGATSSSDFPVTADAVQSAFAGGALDAFVARLAPTLAEPPSYSSLLGGTGDDRGLDVTVGADGAIFVTGFSDSGEFPTTDGAFDGVANGDHDAFVVKVGAAEATAEAVRSGIPNT